MYFTEIFGPLKWHILACVVVFYGVPALQYVVPEQYGMAVYLIAGVLAVLVIAATCIILTIREGFKWYYPLIVIFLYVPSMMMYYDSSMLGNVVAYLCLAYVSQGMGFIIGKIIERNR
ncbi:MAG TPA: hypothetical protein IAC74_03670 [Candidatus Aphodoplasma excrementigallinarum]|uniref:Exosortase n=1 Tax=Candidatus Aphodoplasma excrementigallinarum TaxID=2840673 RepID=A0A9D1SZE7_9FIRM|nr:hypothetical protein [Candidatus Aphodoplasma excrementigallinarum]